MTHAIADNYAVSAKYYDAACAAADLADLPFYLDLARASGGPVLEMGCGTGRVLLPIARAGIETHGVDVSVAMLDILRRKLESEPREVRSRVTRREGDIRSARLGRKFPLVIMPFRPFQHMHTLDDQIAVLRTAACHLTDEGKFAFDVFYPKFDSLFSGLGEERPQDEWPVEGKPGQIIRRWYRKDSIDKINQTFGGVFIFRTVENGHVIHEETDPLHLTWFLYPQLRALFLLAGLEVLEEYGSFGRAPLDNSSTEMVFVLRRAQP